jgi:hypothetical protein
MVDYYDPFTISQIASRAGQMMEPTVSSTGGMTPIYHGTPYLDKISEAGGFDPNKKSYWSPDRNTAEQYAKKGWRRGTPWGKVTGDVLERYVPSEQAQALVKRGFTGGKELVLSGDEATNLYKSGIANIKGSPSWATRAARWFPKVMRAAGRFPLAAFASDALAGTSLLSGGNREVRAGRDFTPSQPNSAVNEYTAGRGSQPTFSRPSANRDFTQTDYGKAYQRGGSVNPHEETARAAREWSPREQYISRSNQDRAYDATVGRFIQESQDDQQRWEQGGGQGPYPVLNQPGWESNVPMSPGWLQASSDRNNSGVMLAMANSPAVNKMKNIYNQVDPFFPEVDVDDQQIGYDFNKNLWGGTLGFGGGYDTEDDAYNAYINWGTNW